CHVYHLALRCDLCFIYVVHLCTILALFRVVFFFFFFIVPPTTEIYTLSLHDALPICSSVQRTARDSLERRLVPPRIRKGPDRGLDRKSTRLNSSHGSISYAVFCLKKKKKKTKNHPQQ